MKKMLSMLLAIVMIISLAACNNNSNDNPNNGDNNNTNKGEAKVNLLTGDEKTKALDLIKDGVESLRSAGVVFNLQYGQDAYATEIHSSNFESMIQYDLEDESGNMVSVLDVYLNDYRRISIGQSEISYDNYIDTLTILERVAYLSDAGIGIVSESTDTTDGYLRYYIDIRGYSNISSIYDFVNDELAYDMVEELRREVALMKNSDSSVNIDYVNQRFEFMMLDPNSDKYEEERHDAVSNLLGAACYTYTGVDEPQDVDLNKLQTNWLFNGYHEIGNWKLEGDWYTTDWEKLGSMGDEEMDAIESLLNTDYKKVNDLMQAHFVEDEANPENSEDSKDNESTREVGDTEATDDTTNNDNSASN